MAWPDASSKERASAHYILRTWCDLTSLLCIAFSALSILYTSIGPAWTHRNAAAEARLQFTFEIAASVGFTAFFFELLTVMVEFSVRSLPSTISGDDSKIVLMIYSILALLYAKMASSADDWVFTDPLANGGPRPVYTLRYLERSFCTPLIFAVSCSLEVPNDSARSDREALDEGIVHARAEEDVATVGGAITWQIKNLVTIPQVALNRLKSTPLVASARCTIVYNGCAFLAVVVNDEFTRWLLICVYFTAFVVASAEQGAQSFILYRFDNKPECATLMAFQIVAGCFNGLLFLLAALGLVSWQVEQTIYTFSDIFAKLLVSAYITSIKRRRNFSMLDGMRRIAGNTAEDVRRLVRQANVPIFSIGRGLSITEWNQKLCELTGIARQQALQMCLPDALKAEDEIRRQTAGHWLKEALEGRDGEVLEMSFGSAVPTGEDETAENTDNTCTVAVSATCQRNFSGEITGVLCVGQDVTQLMQASQTQTALAESLSRLLDTANAPILETDSEYRIVWWNSWMVNMTGVPSRKIRGRPLKLLAPQSTWEPAFQKAMKSQEVECFEICLKDVQGRPRALLLTATQPVAVDDDQIPGVMCFGQDITELKDFGNRKSALMNMVSERLKAPLGEMVELAKSGFEEEDAPPEYRKPFGMISNCAARLMEMVRSINSAAELARDKHALLDPSPVQLQTIIEEVMVLCEKAVTNRSAAPQGQYQKRPKLKLVNKVKSPLPVIQADANRCTQLIYNLVANAVKFTHEGFVECFASHDDTAQEVTICIKDTGIGIAPENTTRIFEPFDQEDVSESRRYSGLGLGLAISREIARKHGGDITVESVQGRGSTFSVTLPYQMAAQAAPSGSKETSGFQRMTSAADVIGLPEAQTDSLHSPSSRVAVGAWLRSGPEVPERWSFKQRSILEMPEQAPRMFTAQQSVRSDSVGRGQLSEVFSLVPPVASQNQFEMTRQESDPAQNLAPPGVTLTETVQKLRKCQEEDEAAKKDAKELKKRIEELQQRIAERKNEVQHSQEQEKMILQSMANQRTLAQKHTELVEQVRKLETVQHQNLMLLNSRQQLDVDFLRQVDLGESVTARIQDPALQIVEQRQAGSERYLQRVMAIAQGLPGPEKDELLDLARSFREELDRLQADLGQKNYFLRARQEKLRNPLLQLLASPEPNILQTQGGTISGY